MKKILSIVIIITLVVCMTCFVFATTTIKDVKPTDPNYDAVQKMIDIGVMTVDKENKFYPNIVITRAAFIKMLVSLMGYPLTDGNTFSDISKHSCKKYIETAVKQGILSTSEYGSAFKPDLPITRLEIAHIIAKALKLEEAYNIAPFVDVKKDGLVNSTYSYYIFRGSIKNKNRYFNPIENFSKSQIASVLYKVYCFKSDKTNYLSTQRKLILDDPNFVKATPNSEFENFMKTEKALEYISTKYFRVENGVVIFKDVANIGFGEMILSDARNKDVNKIVYNVIKDMLSHARKYGKYVLVYYVPTADCVNIQYYNYKSLADAEIQEGNIMLQIHLKPYKDTDKQNFDSVYSWDINKLWSLADDRGYPLAKDYVEEQYGIPLSTMFNDVYGPSIGSSFYKYTLLEYRTECIVGSQRINNSILKINGYNVVNLNDDSFRVWFQTSLN